MKPEPRLRVVRGSWPPKKRSKNSSCGSAAGPTFAVTDRLTTEGLTRFATSVKSGRPANPPPAAVALPARRASAIVQAVVRIARIEANLIRSSPLDPAAAERAVQGRRLDAGSATKLRRRGASSSSGRRAEGFLDCSTRGGYPEEVMNDGVPADRHEEPS